MTIGILLILVILVILALLGACMFTKVKKVRKSKDTFETYDKSTHVIFLTKEETFEVVQNATDFWSQLNDKEWQKRNVSGLHEYLSEIKKDLVNPSPDQQKSLTDLCKRADLLLSKIQLPYFCGKKAAQMKWRIGLFQDRKYEYGWPHTFGNVIMWPVHLTDSLETMIHEKVHVYQKMYPEDVNLYLQQEGFKKLRRGYHERPNPDTDNWLYEWNGVVYTEDLHTTLPSPDPNSQVYEHPFERMAILIAREAMKNIA